MNDIKKQMKVLNRFTEAQLQRVVNNEYGEFANIHVLEAKKILKERKAQTMYGLTHEFDDVYLKDIEITYQKKGFYLYHLSTREANYSFTNVKELETVMENIISMRFFINKRDDNFKIKVTQIKHNLYWSINVETNFKEGAK